MEYGGGQVAWEVNPVAEQVPYANYDLLLNYGDLLV